MYIGSVHVPEQGFWVLCYGFYVFDNIRATKVGTFFMSRNGRGGWRLVVPAYRFELRDKAYALLSLVTPWKATCRLDWPSGGVRDTSARALQALDLRISALTALRIVSCCCFALYFACAPVLTALIGLPATLGAVLTLHVTGTVATALALARARRHLQAGRLQIAKLIFECFLCPGVQANAFRRAYLDLGSVRGDALGVALAGCDPRQAADLAHGLETYLDHLAERGELTGEAARAGARCVGKLREKSRPDLQAMPEDLP